MNPAWVVSYVLLWVLVLAMAAMILLLYRQLGEIYLGTREGRSREGLGIGKHAPSFTLSDLEGQRVVVPRPTPTLLVFGTPHCGPCRQLIPDLIAFTRETTPHLHVYFVAGEDPAENRTLANGVTLPFPILTQPKFSIAEQYEVKRSPFAFYIDENSIIRDKAVVNNLEQLQRLVVNKSRVADVTELIRS